MIFTSTDRKNTNQIGHSGIPWWSIVFWLLLWEALARLPGNHLFFISPGMTVKRLVELASVPAFWQTLGHSLLRIGGGFFFSCIFAVFCAALAAKFQFFREFLTPPVFLMKNLPMVSIIILILICFSSRHLVLIISFLLIFPILYTNILTGIQETDPLLLEMAKIFRLTPAVIFRYIYLPEVMPYFISACKVTLGLAWKAGIAAEVIGTPTGSIGERLQQAKVYLNTPDLFAWTLAVLLLSFGCEKLILSLLDHLSRQLSQVNFKEQASD